MHRIEIYNILNEYALYLEADGRSGYSSTIGNAAENIRRADTIPPNPAQIDGVGPKLRDLIMEYEVTGEIEELEELKQKYPYLGQLSKIRGVGPERARRIYETLGISTIDEVIEADLTKVHGIGEKTASKITRSAKGL
jgi:DNA polymerase (family 10)